jgi:hypothetical protein
MKQAASGSQPHSSNSRNTAKGANRMPLKKSVEERDQVIPAITCMAEAYLKVLLSCGRWLKGMPQALFQFAQ